LSKAGVGFDEAERGGVVDVSDTHESLHIWNPKQSQKTKLQKKLKIKKCLGDKDSNTEK
jgi:hypothetical protein